MFVCFGGGMPFDFFLWYCLVIFEHIVVVTVEVDAS